jgi:hypothetical protein
MRLSLSKSLSALVLSLAVLSPAMAEARCVEAGDLRAGITFKRQDGRLGLVRSGKDRGVVVVDYDSASGVSRDMRRSLWGVYETRTTLQGKGGETVISWKFEPRPQEPQAGGGWAGTVREGRRGAGEGSQLPGFGALEKDEIEAVRKGARILRVSYSFLPERVVKLSGCKYRVVPVEAVFAGAGQGFSRRWVYFTDLGFGLETRRDGEANGIVALVVR